MRIALVIDWPSRRLADKTMYLNELQQRLNSDGTQASTFVISNSGFLERIDASTGIMRILNSGQIIDKLNNFDLIHIQFSFPLGFAFGILKIFKKLKIPIIIHTHGYDVFTVESIDYGVRRNIMGRILTNFAWKRADRLIAVCNKAQHELTENGVSKTKVDLLYNGIDESFFSKSNSNFTENKFSSLREESDFLLLTVGSDIPVKNHENLINAFTMLCKKHNSTRRMKLLIVGKSRGNTPSNHENNILYLGSLEHRELPALYNTCDAFILPSLSEAHPWSLLEAMSCGLLTIASAVGGIPETIDDERFLISAPDHVSIFKKLELVLGLSQEERKEIGWKNREKVLSSFTFNQHVQRLRKIYLDSITFSKIDSR